MTTLARDPGPAVRVLAALALLLPAASFAQEYESEPRLFRFEDLQPVLQSQLSIPLTVDVVSGVVENLGATPKLTGDAEVGLYLEGESNLRWPVLDEDKAVRQEITPLENSSYLGMTANMQLTVDVGATIVGNPFYFTVVSQQATFDDDIRKFTPFLLPYQGGDTVQVLQPQASSGKFNFPVSIPVISNGTFNLGVGVNVYATPVCDSTIGGQSLDTLVTFDDGTTTTFSTDGSDLTTDGVFANVIELQAQQPTLEVTNAWVADISNKLGYLVGVDFSIQIDAFGLSIPFSFNLYEQQFNLFQTAPGGQEHTFEAHKDTAPYEHPLPMVGVARDRIEFADQQPGASKTFKFGVINDGVLDLEGTASLENDAEGVFSFAPPELSVEPGGQQGVNVTFSPQKPGEYRATLVLETNDPAAPRVEVPIVGTSVVGSGDPGGLVEDPSGLYGQGSRDTYQTCGCASSTMTPRGLAFLAWVPALVLLRRRRVTPRARPAART